MRAHLLRLREVFSDNDLIGAARSMKSVDGLIIIYLLAHGVIALLVDIQSILPDVAPELYERYKGVGLTAVVQQWVEQEGDFLVGANPLWFKAVIGAEVLLQVPLCFVLGFGWITSSEWVRTPGLCYSVHVLTTMVPIMTELCTDPRPTLTCKLIYGVWVLLPAILLLRCGLSPSPLFDAQPRTLWKIALPADVEAWETSGLLVGSSLDLTDGFMHASDARMVRKVASMFFCGQQVFAPGLGATGVAASRPECSSAATPFAWFRRPCCLRSHRRSCLQRRAGSTAPSSPTQNSPSA